MLAVIGLAISIAMLRILLERVARTPTRTPTTTAARPAEPEPERTLPPPPVSFPTPPAVGAAEVPRQPTMLEALGSRRVEALSTGDIELWSERLRALAVAWPELSPDRREAVMRSIADWMAQSADETELAVLRRRLDDLEGAAVDPRIAELSGALRVMLLAQVVSSERLSPVAAGDQAFSSGSGARPADALVAWALDRIPGLIGGIGRADARPRWSGWLDVLQAIERPQDRTSLALAAIDLILRAPVRLDTQGLAADATGSLLRVLPADRNDPGFRMVSDRMALWLLDAGIASDRLWALGGIWRSVATPPDDRLLVGERDTMPARNALAQRWRTMAGGSTAPVWQALLDPLNEPLPRPDAPLVRRIEALTARLTLLRRIDALTAGRDPAQLAPAATQGLSARWPEMPETVEPRWSRSLLSPRPEERTRTLQSMRSAELLTLAQADFEALANRALSAPSREERQLAQQLIRETLLESGPMRVALAHEIAVAADPRHALDLLQDIGGYDLPTDDVAALRAAALAAVLANLPPGPSLEPVAQALASLEAEVALWANDSQAGERDAGLLAWSVAERMQAAGSGLRPLEPLDAVVRGASDRIRRLKRLAPTGPRALAGAWAVISDLEAARLAVQRAGEHAAIAGFASAISADRARASDAIEQAGLSLDALCRIRLAALGAPLPAHAGGAAVVVAGSADDALAQAEAERSRDGSDSRQARARLAQAIGQDGSLAVSAALLLAERSSDARARRAWIEQAQALGASIHASSGTSTQATLALAQLLVAAERGQLDRLVAPKRGSPGLTELERFASAQGVSVDTLLLSLRTSTDPSREPRIDSLREWVLHALDPAARPWLGALSGGDAHAMPEADALQPARLLPSIE
jgi:hypothetical protein